MENVLMKSFKIKKTLATITNKDNLRDDLEKKPN